MVKIFTSWEGPKKIRDEKGREERPLAGAPGPNSKNQRIGYDT